MSNQQPLYQIPEVGFLKLQQIVKIPGDTKPAILPISRSSWLAGIKSGKYPSPVKIGARSVAWRRSDILALLERLGAEGSV